MKIGILTQPLKHNYGGLLQAYALQEILRSFGHETIVINRDYTPQRDSYIQKFLTFIKDIIKSIIYGFPYLTPSPRVLDKVTINTRAFIKEYITTSCEIFSDAELRRYIIDTKFDGIVVGSDQVWRPQYSPNIYNYYLNVAENLNIKRFSYAASFGVGNWEYSAEQTKECGRLLRFFNNVSVREVSGVELCKNNFGVEAKFVLDPTLLHDKYFYLRLIKHDDCQLKVNNSFFCYILDENKSIDKRLFSVINRYGGSISKCMPKRKPSGWRVNKYIEDYKYPSPCQWIENFNDARVVITDSFHGTVFSIIFNKPFWVLGNKKRGMDRFLSLLSIFGLEERLVTIEELEEKNIYEEIDWTIVNIKLDKYKSESLSFLKNSLNE